MLRLRMEDWKSGVGKAGGRHSWPAAWVRSHNARAEILRLGWSWSPLGQLVQHGLLDPAPGGSDSVD